MKNNFKLMVRFSRIDNVEAALITRTASCDESCFKVIDSAKTYQLNVKEALHILWEGPNLNKQVQHYNFSLTF